MTAEDWGAEREWVKNALDNIQQALEGLHMEIKSMNEARAAADVAIAGRIATTEERVKWIAFGMSTVISVLVSAVTTIILSVARVFLAKVGG